MTHPNIYIVYIPQQPVQTQGALAVRIQLAEIKHRPSISPHFCQHASSTKDIHFLCNLPIPPRKPFPALTLGRPFPISHLGVGGIESFRCDIACTPSRGIEEE